MVKSTTSNLQVQWNQVNIRPREHGKVFVKSSVGIICKWVNFRPLTRVGFHCSILLVTNKLGMQ